MTCENVGLASMAVLFVALAVAVVVVEQPVEPDVAPRCACVEPPGSDFHLHLRQADLTPSWPADGTTGALESPDTAQPL